MDNAFVHYVIQDRVVKVARRQGVWVRFLPPYSPDFNLIKESFRDLKAFIRRYYHRERSRFLIYQVFLKWTIKESGTGEGGARRARVYFKNTGIYKVADN
jgi:transposase